MAKPLSCLQKGRKIIERLAELLVIGLMGGLCLYLLGAFYSLYQFSLLSKIPDKSWLPHLDTLNWHSQLYSWLSANDKAGPHQLYYSFLTCSEKTINLDILCQLQVPGRCRTHQPAEVMDSLWVVAPVYAYDQETTVYLYQLHDSFRSYIESFGLPLCTIEGIRKDFDQSYLLTQPQREPFDIQVQIYDEDYIRENLINVALNKIPNWEYVAWIDGHQIFDNVYWWEETIVKIEKEKTIQLYQKLTRYNLRNQSFLYKDGIVALSLYQTDLDFYRGGVMPEYGGALAIRKEVYNQLGSILDICIGAGCDLTFIRASLPNTHSFVILQANAPYYAANFDDWLIHARSVINASRAVVRGTLHHFEHEHHFEYDAVPKAYQKAGFNPRRDLARDENGTIIIINPNIKRIVPDLKVGWSISK